MGKMAKIALVVLLLLAITYFHYNSGSWYSDLHVMHREAYLIPILLSAFWFGKKGGLLVSVISLILFFPKVLRAEPISSTSGFINILEFAMFIVVAYLLGHYQDVRRSHWRAFFKTPHKAKVEPRSEYGHSVLLCIDNSPRTTKAARYVVDTFHQHEDTLITVAGFIREPSGDVFPSAREYEKARAENERMVTDLVEQARQTLLEGGFPEKAVTTKTFRLQKETIAERIIEEKRKFMFDTIVLAGAKMSKAEEFILGNTAVKLVREGGPSVVTVF